jgi:hypothetical protein
MTDTECHCQQCYLLNVLIFSLLCIVRKPLWKLPLETLRKWWENNIHMAVQENVCENENVTLPVHVENGDMKMNCEWAWTSCDIKPWHWHEGLEDSWLLKINCFVQLGSLMRKNRYHLVLISGRFDQQLPV